jgi:hypothetical protein
MKNVITEDNIHFLNLLVAIVIWMRVTFILAGSSDQSGKPRGNSYSIQEYLLALHCGLGLLA